MNESMTTDRHPLPALCLAKTRLVPLLACLFFIMVTTASAVSAQEKLVYDLSWTGIKAGSATQEFFTEKGGIRIVSTARSADWISAFFPVEDRVESILGSASPGQIGLPLNFRMKIREGSHRRDREVIFDHDKGQAHYIDHMSGEKTDLAIGKNTYDPYSSFYYIRRLPLEPGRSVFVSILDNKQLWTVEVQVLKKERIKTVLGEVDTIVIKPLMKSEGIFQRKGAIYIWLTDDARRIPVMMKTKVAIGSITATLVGGNY
jgi:hypothetical protein